MSEAEAMSVSRCAPHWVWTAINPESKLLLNVQVGDRTLALAQAVLHQLTQLSAPGCVPLFLSNGYPHYLRPSWRIRVLGAARLGQGHKPRAQAALDAVAALLYAQVMET